MIDNNVCFYFTDGKTSSFSIDNSNLENIYNKSYWVFQLPLPEGRRLSTIKKL